MKKLVTILVTIGFLAATMAPMAYADGRGHYRGYGFGHYHGHGYPSYGYHGRYHASDDFFWLGLGVGVLTGAFASGIYYTSPPPPRVVYYEPQTVVVPPPTVVTPPQQFGRALPADYGQVTVVAAELNMRSGPGLDREVTGKAIKGEVLDVIESIKDWFYIRTPAGTYGWVMDKYTEPAQPVG